MHASPTARNVCFFFILIFTFPVRSPSFVVVVVVVVVACLLLLLLQILSLYTVMYSLWTVFVRDVLAIDCFCPRCVCYCFSFLFSVFFLSLCEMCLFCPRCACHWLLLSEACLLFTVFVRDVFVINYFVRDVLVTDWFCPRWACYWLIFTWFVTGRKHKVAYLLYLVAVTVDCNVSRTVIQLLTCDLMTCIFNWCKRLFDCVIRQEVTLSGWRDAKVKELTN